MNHNKTPRLLTFADFETTGLPGQPHFQPLEAGMIVVDTNLDVVAELPSILYTPEGESLAQMNDFVRQMHTKTGLLERLQTEKTYSVAEAEGIMLTFLQGAYESAGEDFEWQLAGNSIGSMEIPLIDAFHPRLSRTRYYRSIDVSSFDEFLQRANPELLSKRPAKTSDHTVHGDNLAAIAELRWYQNLVKA